MCFGLGWSAAAVIKDFAQWWPEQARSGADRHDALFPSLTSMYQEDQVNFMEQF
jgi:hypothetical protein